MNCGGKISQRERSEFQQRLTCFEYRSGIRETLDSKLGTTDDDLREDCKSGCISVQSKWCNYFTPHLSSWRFSPPVYCTVSDRPRECSDRRLSRPPRTSGPGGVILWDKFLLSQCCQIFTPGTLRRSLCSGCRRWTDRPRPRVWCCWRPPGWTCGGVWKKWITKMLLRSLR